MKDLTEEVGTNACIVGKMVKPDELVERKGQQQGPMDIFYKSSCTAE